MNAISVDMVSNEFLLSHGRPRRLIVGLRGRFRTIVGSLAMGMALQILLTTSPCCPANAAASESPRGQVITVVLRYDDYSARSFTELEESIIQVFRARHMQITFSVIPAVTAGNSLIPSNSGVILLSPAKARLLREAIKSGAVDPALHGYSHQTASTSLASEFQGVDYETQLRKLSLARGLLEKDAGVKITTFVPPWNTYDGNTVKALETLGFTCISADAFGDAPEGSKLKYVPDTRLSTDSLDVLKETVEEARHSSDPRPLIALHFHDVEFHEYNYRGRYTIKALSDFLDWAAAQKDVRVLSVGQASREIPDLGVNRLALNRTAFESLWAPPFLRSRYEGTQMSSAFARTQLRMIYAKVALYLAALAVAAFAAACAAAAIVRRIGFRLTAVLIWLLMLSACLMDAFIDGTMGDKVLAGMVAATSVLAASLFSTRRKKRVRFAPTGGAAVRDSLDDLYSQDQVRSR